MHQLKQQKIECKRDIIHNLEIGMKSQDSENVHQNLEIVQNIYIYIYIMSVYIFHMSN